MDKIAVVDFGGQYAHLIANRIRRLGVYAAILSTQTPLDEFRNYRGIVLSGGPHSVTDPRSPSIHHGIFELGLPILGICYGMQWIAHVLGGKVESQRYREYGRAYIQLIEESVLLKECGPRELVWMSHGDSVTKVPLGFKIIAITDDYVTAVIGDEKRHIYGVQFHPEVTDTLCGMKLLGNFLDICHCERSWNSQSYIEEIRKEILNQCKGRKVFLMVSGGVDSTVTFALLNEVLGPDQVYGCHVDTGLMRKNESADILNYMKAHGFHNLDIIDAKDKFLRALDGITDPEEKRQIIGRLFLEVKLEEEQKLGLNLHEWLFAQGTIYPDTIESAGTQHSDRIKTHHNRVDVVIELIENGLVIEPLRFLYKDEVRELGRYLGLPETLLERHPFPGPGLGVRVLCSKEERLCSWDICSLDIRQKLLDQIGNSYQISVLPIKSVGVQGDSRSYAYPVVLCEGPLNWEVLTDHATRITNNFPLFNRVVYRLVGEGNTYWVHRATLTSDRLDLLRFADDVATQIIRQTGEYNRIWQMPVILLPVINQEGKESIVLRPVISQEAMTARFYPMSMEAINRIVKELKQHPQIGDIFYDITHKPPATIEWE